MSVTSNFTWSPPATATAIAVARLHARATSCCGDGIEAGVTNLGGRTGEGESLVSDEVISALLLIESF